MDPVFISHCSEDKVFVERLATDLTVHGVPVWYSEWEIKVGDSIVRKVSDGIDSSAFLIVVLSAHSTRSEWVSRELNAAFMVELERPEVFVLPVRIDDAAIPTLLKDKRYADFRAHYEDGLEKLLQRLRLEAAFSASAMRLRSHYLPPFHKRYTVNRWDYNRADDAIEALEQEAGLKVSNYQDFRFGSLALQTAAINSQFQRIQVFDRLLAFLQGARI